MLPLRAVKNNAGALDDIVVGVEHGAGDGGRSPRTSHPALRRIRFLHCVVTERRRCGSWERQADPAPSSVAPAPRRDIRRPEPQTSQTMAKPHTGDYLAQSRIDLDPTALGFPQKFIERVRHIVRSRGLLNPFRRHAMNEDIPIRRARDLFPLIPGPVPSDYDHPGPSGTNSQPFRGFGWQCLLGTKASAVRNRATSASGHNWSDSEPLADSPAVGDDPLVELVHGGEHHDDNQGRQQRHTQ
jgi:hypothetical protein